MLKPLYVIKMIRLTANIRHLFYSYFQWQWPAWVYIVIRVLISLYTIGILIFFFIRNSGYTVMQFLTVWTYILLTLHFFVTALISVLHHFRRTSPSASVDNEHKDGSRENPGFVIEKGQIEIENPQTCTEDRCSSSEKFQNALNDNITWYMKLSWLLADIVQVFSICVTAIYFSAIYPTLNANVSEIELFVDFNVHAVNSVLVLIDLLVCARPVRILHFIYPSVYGMVYVTFSVVVFEVSGTVIYNVLDYTQPVYPVVTVISMALVAIPLLQLAIYGIYRLKDYLFGRIYNC